MKSRAILAIFYLFVSIPVLAGVTTDVRFEQKPGTQLPKTLSVINEHGRTVTLGDYFGNKPIVLSFVYYGCPNLCTLVLNGLASAINRAGLRSGKDLELLSLSIDPKEKPSLSLAKKRSYLARIGLTGDDNPSWNFLTAPEKTIKTLTALSGFHYRYDPVAQEYNHPSGLLILTPEGIISRYFFGIQFDPQELKASLLDASIGKSHRTLGELILNCFHYQPQNGKYGHFVVMLLQVFSGLTILALLTLFVGLGRRKVYE